MTVSIKSRLGAMMFLQYFIWGAWYVTLGTWLSATLHFPGREVGWAAGTTAVGALVSPFLVGLIVDRWIAVEKALGLLHALGAVLLAVASLQTSFGRLYACVLLYSLCYMPTLALSNTLAFRQMREPRLEFGPIRVFGTLGWIVAGLLVGTLGVEATAMPLRLAAGCSVLLAVYCPTLPHTPPLAQARAFRVGQILPLEALRLLRRPSLAIFAAASFLICIPLQFYYAFTNLFLNESGVQNAAAKMTGGQMSELFCMLLIPWFFRRLGVKGMLAIGMAAWTLRYLLFAYGNAGALVWMLWGGILIHGICYDFFFVVGQIYIDHEAPPALRAAAQGMMTLITYGAGMLMGAWLSGGVVDAHTLAAAGIGGGASHDWRAIWLFAAAAAGGVLILFLAVFSDDKREPA